MPMPEIPMPAEPFPAQVRIAFDSICAGQMFIVQAELLSPGEHFAMMVFLRSAFVWARRRSVDNVWS